MNSARNTAQNLGIPAQYQNAGQSQHTARFLSANDGRFSSQEIELAARAVGAKLGFDEGKIR